MKICAKRRPYRTTSVCRNSSTDAIEKLLDSDDFVSNLKMIELDEDDDRDNDDEDEYESSASNAKSDDDSNEN